MDPLVRRRWRTSPDADAPPPSTGAVIRWREGSSAATNPPARSDTLPQTIKHSPICQVFCLFARCIFDERPRNAHTRATEARPAPPRPLRRWDSPAGVLHCGADLAGELRSIHPEVACVSMLEGMC